MSEVPGEVYLGDGLYVSFDGWAFKLRAPRLKGDHEVYLDLDVLKVFIEYVESVKKAQEQNNGHQ